MEPVRAVACAAMAVPPNPERYDPQSFEERWVAAWERERAHAAPGHPDPARKRYVLEMFPYPSGDMHMGHVENYSIADAIARQWRMKGHDVLHRHGKPLLPSSLGLVFKPQEASAS